MKSKQSKKSAQKSAKSSKQNDGRKSSGAKLVPHYALTHLNAQIMKMDELITQGFPPEDIQIVLRYKTIGGIVEERGTKELQEEKKR